MPKSDKSGKGAKSILCYIPEVLRPVTPVPTGTDPNTLPYLEWVDTELNAEKWELPKTKEVKPAKGEAAVPPEPPPQFEDPHVVHLPKSLPVYEWKRPVAVFPKATFVMFRDVSEYPDLVKESKHILHSDFMRSFISAVGILEYLGNTQTFPIEFATPKFTPNTTGIPWRPWHHIYSMCKAGKGQKPTPQVNNLGKYVLRLFWMGCWRKIYVDDLLPVEVSNHVQLPLLSCDNPNDPSTQIIEMWPFVLCKGLLKLASLSYSTRYELKDFNIIQCLTGWCVQTVEVEGMRVQDIWDMCSGYSDHYSWPEPGTGSPKSTKSAKSAKAAKAPKGKAGKKVPNFLDDENAPLPFHLVASCTDMRKISDEEVPDISPCWSHSFLIDQTRNIPLIKPEPLPELARWKRFRWLAWAVAEGKWPAPILIPIKCFKVVSALKKCSEHVTYEPLSKEALDIKKSVAVIEEVASKKQGKSDKGSKADKGSKGSKGSKAEKGSKAGTGSKTNKSGKEVALPPDPSLWGDFNKLGRFIQSLSIYFKPSQFKNNIKITDITQAGGAKAKPEKPKKGESEPQLLIWNNELLVSRNEPIYLFADSLDYKALILNFSQIGNDRNLDKRFDFEVDNLKTPSEKSLVKEPPRRCHHADFIIETESLTDESSVTLTESEEPVCCETSAHERDPFAYITIEKYDWQTAQVGDVVTVFNTNGSKTVLIDLKPGRFVSRLWVKSDTCFSIQILSDTPILIGTFETIIESMRTEPETLLQTCNDISSAYGQLVQRFGTPEYKEALTIFFKSYLPNARLNPMEKFQIHWSFIYELLMILKDICPFAEFQEMMFALRVLFINPNIKLPTYKVDDTITESDSCSISETSEEVDFAKKCQRAAVTIQAFFKRIYVRKLKLLHDQAQPRYMKIFECLKKIYTEVFGVVKRMFVCSKLLRNLLLGNPDMNSLRKRYSLFYDLNNTIHLQHFTGEILIIDTTWVPIARYAFYTNSPFPVLIKICLFCDFSKYMVRVFNNEDNKEIIRHTNNTVVHSYESTPSGYTVLCYGWSQTECTKQWKLEFITLKQRDVSLIIIPPCDIHNHILKDNYLPNVNNILCKCLISIKNDISITVRLCTCYDNVKFRLRCLNETGRVFGEAIGVKNVILPILQLEYVPVIEVPEIDTNTGSFSITGSLTKRSRSRSLEGSTTHRRTSASLKRKSLNNSLKRFSNASKRNSSSITSESIVYKDTVYVIEASVLDETWPLLMDEWDLVNQIKNSKLVGPLLLSQLDLTESEVMTTSTVKFKETLFARTSKEKDLKDGEEHASLSIETNTHRSPLWTLETISYHDDHVIPIVDKRREEEIKQLKMKWFEEDPTRYERSKQLREEYLLLHYIKFPSGFESYDSNMEESLVFSEQSQSFNCEDLSIMHEQFKHLRTNRKPNGDVKMLPSFHLSPFDFVKSGATLTPSLLLGEKEDEEDEEIERETTVKTTEDEEKEIVLREDAIADFENYFQSFEGDMQKYLYDQLETIKFLQVFYNGCREESAEIMKDSIKLREKIIEAIIEAELANIPPVPEKAKKGKK